MPRRIAARISGKVVASRARVLRQRRVEHVFGVVAGVDVGGGAGQHDAVAGAEHGFEFERVAQRRQDQRRAAGAAHDGVDVFGLRRVILVRTDIAGAGWDEDDGAAHEGLP